MAEREEAWAAVCCLLIAWDAGCRTTAPEWASATHFRECGNGGRGGWRGPHTMASGALQNADAWNGIELGLDRPDSRTCKLGAGQPYMPTSWRLVGRQRRVVIVP